MADKILDAKGLNCPLPILKAKKALKDYDKYLKPMNKARKYMMMPQLMHQYRSGTCYQDRLRQVCSSRAYREVLTACLDNSFQINNPSNAMPIISLTKLASPYAR